MKTIEVYTNCYGEYGLEAMFEHLPLRHCRAVELALKPHLVAEAHVTEEQTITDAASDEELERATGRFAEAGISVSTANGGDTLSDPAGVERVRRRMQIASALGAHTFVASIGWDGDDPSGAYPVIARLGAVAAELGLLVALETHAPYVANADAALRTLEQVGSQNVTINWDTANIYYMNDGVDGAAELRRVADRVGHVHLKDSRKRAGEWFFPALGEGTIDFAEIFGILDEASFDGTMSLEIEGIRGETADLALRRRRIERSLEHLQQLGLL